MSEEKTYVGKGKVFGKYGQIKIGLRVDQLVANDKGYCNIIIQEMRQPDKYGNTHTAVIDTWKPDGQQSQPQQTSQPQTSKQQQSEPIPESDLPF